MLVQATGRLRKNAHYFKVNYLMVVFTVTLITLAFNPTSLIVLGLLAMAWIYLFVVRQSPIVIGGRTFRCLLDPLVDPFPLLHTDAVLGPECLLGMPYSLRRSVA